MRCWLGGCEGSLKAIATCMTYRSNDDFQFLNLSDISLHRQVSPRSDSKQLQEKFERCNKIPLIFSSVMCMYWTIKDGTDELEKNGICCWENPDQSQKLKGCQEFGCHRNHTTFAVQVLRCNSQVREGHQPHCGNAQGGAQAAGR